MNELRWGDPDAALWFVAVVVIGFGLLWLALWRRARRQALEAQGPLVAQLDARGGAMLAARAALVLASGALLVVALMRPQFGAKATELKNMGIDVAIALDASKSMKAGDVVPDRLGAARFEIHRLLDGLSGGRVALVPFAGLAFVQTPLTSDHQVVKSYLDDLRVEDMPRGGTAIGRAIVEGVRVLVPPEQLEGTPAELPETAGTRIADELPIDTVEGANHKALVVMTDGDDHEGDPVAAAELAKRFGIKLYVVGVGTSQGRPVPIVNDQGQVTGTMKAADGRTPLFSELNEGLLRQVAELTGGAYYALGPQGLGDGLARALDALEKQEYEATFQDLRDDRYQIALVPAIVLLVLEAMLSGRRRRRRGEGRA